MRIIFPALLFALVVFFDSFDLTSQSFRTPSDQGIPPLNEPPPLPRRRPGIGRGREQGNAEPAETIEHSGISSTIIRTPSNQRINSINQSPPKLNRDFNDQEVHSAPVAPHSRVAVQEEFMRRRGHTSQANSLGNTNLRRQISFGSPPRTPIFNHINGPNSPAPSSVGSNKSHYSSPKESRDNYSEGSHSHN